MSFLTFMEKNQVNPSGSSTISAYPRDPFLRIHICKRTNLQTPILAQTGHHPSLSEFYGDYNPNAYEMDRILLTGMIQ